MKNIIELPISELKTALTGLGKVVSKRSTLAVLQSILVTRNKGQVSLQGTDLDSFVTYRTFSSLYPWYERANGVASK